MSPKPWVRGRCRCPRGRSARRSGSLGGPGYRRWNPGGSAWRSRCRSWTPPAPATAGLGTNRGLPSSAVRGHRRRPGRHQHGQPPAAAPHSAGSAGPDAALRTDRRSPSHLSTLTPCWRSSSSPDGRPVRAAVRVCAGPLSSPPRTGAAAPRHQLVAHPAFVVTKRGPVAVVEFLHHLKSPPPGQHIASDELRSEALGLHGMPSTMQLLHHRRRVKSAPPISW